MQNPSRTITVCFGVRCDRIPNLLSLQQTESMGPILGGFRKLYIYLIFYMALGFASQQIRFGLANTKVFICGCDDIIDKQYSTVVSLR